MHNCSVASGDAWLRRLMRQLVDSAAYRRGGTAIVVTFDESDKDRSDSRLVTVVVSPSTVPGTRVGTRFDHYALLRTTEDLLGVPEHLGRAAHARSMRAAFNF